MKSSCKGVIRPEQVPRLRNHEGGMGWRKDGCWRRQWWGRGTAGNEASIASSPLVLVPVNLPCDSDMHCVPTSALLRTKKQRNQMFKYESFLVCFLPLNVRKRRKAT